MGASVWTAVVALAAIMAAATAFAAVDLTRTGTGLPNVPPLTVMPYLVRLEWLAVQLRARGARITSGFRSPGVNEAVGGVESSLHVEGRALDFVADTDDAKAACDRLCMDLWRSGFLRRRPLYHDVGSGLHGHVELSD